MKKATLIVSILLLTTLGLLWHIKALKYVQTFEIPSITPGKDTKSTNDLKITFLDVGQGDAAFVNFPDGEKMLVDCSLDARILAALGRVMPYYDKQIDYLVVTHPDMDHYGGCIDVLNRFQVKNIIYNGMKKEHDKAWQWFWDLVQKEGANYLELDNEKIFDIAGSTIDFLYPNKPVSDLIKTDLYKNYNGNNLSIVFTLNYFNHQVLFTGDAESGLEKYLLDTYGEKLKSDILKVGHHGSSGSSSKEFLDIIKPIYSIISVGSNKYGHPTTRVLKRLERVGAKILRTDELKDVECLIGERVVCDGKGW